MAFLQVCEAMRASSVRASDIPRTILNDPVSTVYLREETGYMVQSSKRREPLRSNQVFNAARTALEQSRCTRVPLIQQIDEFHEHLLDSRHGCEDESIRGMMRMNVCEPSDFHVYPRLLAAIADHNRTGESAGLDKGIGPINADTLLTFRILGPSPKQIINRTFE